VGDDLSPLVVGRLVRGAHLVELGAKELGEKGTQTRHCAGRSSWAPRANWPASSLAGRKFNQNAHRRTAGDSPETPERPNSIGAQWELQLQLQLQLASLAGRR